MARLDDDQLNISENVARALGYAPRPRRPRQPATVPAHAAPREPRRDAGDVIGWIVTGLFGVFGCFLLLTVVSWVIVLGRAHASPTMAAGVNAVSQLTESAPSTPAVAQHPINSPSAPEPQSAADQLPAAQPQSPPVTETTDLEIDSGRTSAPQSESVPNSVGASPASFEWVCAEGQMLCGLQDPNGKYIQSFSIENGKMHASGINPNAVLPRSWSCSDQGEPKTNMYCTTQDENGQFLQGVLYDGQVMKVFKNGGRCIQGCSQD